MDKNLDLNTSGSLKQSDESMAGATGASRTDLRRGYSVVDSTHEEYPCYGPYCMGDGPREDCDGSTYEGDYAAKGGFLNRPTGRER